MISSNYFTAYQRLYTLDTYGTYKSLDKDETVPAILLTENKKYKGFTDSLKNSIKGFGSFLTKEK